MDPDELAVLEFCYGGGRAVPRSVFLGRVVAPDEPLWLAEDAQAALDYHAYLKSLCPGCQGPREETFDISMDDRYDVVPLVCHKCRARDLKAWSRSRQVEQGSPPLLGEYYIVTPEPPDTNQPALGTNDPLLPDAAVSV